MIDMDGTVYKGRNVIPGSIEFIEYLKEHEFPFVFLTNNSSRARSYYLDKVRSMGFDVEEKNVLTSNIATMRYVLDKYPGKTVFPLAADDVIDEMKSYGLNISYKDPDIVYLTFDKTLDYTKLNEAFHHIQKGARLVAKDSYDVDIGPFIRLFESLSGVKAEVIGKPNRMMLQMAATEMGINPGGAVMIGDRLYTDIRMASDAGIASILVLSGETSASDLVDSDVKPTYILDSVAEIPSMLRCV